MDPNAPGFGPGGGGGYYGGHQQQQPQQPQGGGGYDPYGQPQQQQGGGGGMMPPSSPVLSAYGGPAPQAMSPVMGGYGQPPPPPPPPPPPQQPQYGGGGGGGGYYEDNPYPQQQQQSQQNDPYGYGAEQQQPQGGYGAEQQQPQGGYGAEQHQQGGYGAEQQQQGGYGAEQQQQGDYGAEQQQGGSWDQGGGGYGGAQDEGYGYPDESAAAPQGYGGGDGYGDGGQQGGGYDEYGGGVGGYDDDGTGGAPGLMAEDGATVVGGAAAANAYYQPVSRFVPHLPPGAALSAVAFDPTHAAVYAACHTSSLGRKKSRPPPAPTGSGLAATTAKAVPTRASFMAVHTIPAGDVSSACAAHPEAPSVPDILDRISKCVFGCATSPADSLEAQMALLDPRKRGHTRVPPHAFRPPHSHPSAVSAAQDPAAANTPMRGSYHHLGVGSILPFSGGADLSSLGDDEEELVTSGPGYVCTASPAGVRLHTRGGLLLCENANECHGSTCGTFNPTASAVSYNTGFALSSDPYADVTHATVGGAPSLAGPLGGDGCHLHCVDLYSGSPLRSISSHRLAESGPPGSEREIAVSALVTNWDKRTIAAGCTDGTVRLFDGGWRGGGGRSGEVAKVKSHVGGVVSAAVSLDGNLMATVGYSYRGGGASTTPYAFPDPHLLVYDVRYLGRGGIVHPFTGSRGGPRFAHFVPGDSRNAVLVGSGQSGGGMQIVVPFEALEKGGTETSTVAAGSFIQPDLGPGEAVSCSAVDGRDLALGTTRGEVLLYRVSDAARTMHGSSGGDADASSGGMGAATAEFVPGSASYSPSRSTGGDGMMGAAEDDDVEKLELINPPYDPPAPDVSIDPTILLASARGMSISVAPGGASLANALVLTDDPPGPDGSGGLSLSHPATFGPLADAVILPGPRMKLSAKLEELLKEAGKGGGGGERAGERGAGAAGSRAQVQVPTDGDFVKSVDAKALGLDLLACPPVLEAAEDEDEAGKNKQEAGGKKGKDKKAGLPNPNKLLRSRDGHAAAYDADADPRGRIYRDRRTGQWRAAASGGGDRHQQRHGHRPAHHGHHHPGFDVHDDDGGEEGSVPSRYRLAVRPPFSSLSAAAYCARRNDTGLWPGWDCPPGVPNGFAAPVLMLLYFTREVREATRRAQFDPALFGDAVAAAAVGNGTSKGKKNGGGIGNSSLEPGPALSAELGFLFHQMEGLSSHALSYPDPPLDPSSTRNAPQVGPFVPQNFLTTLAALPEAAALALLDGAAAAVEPARRPEAFYRFVLHHIDRELSSSSSSSPDSGDAEPPVVDALQAMDFVGVNEFVSGDGEPSVSTTRALTVDLSYEPFLSSSRTSSSASASTSSSGSSPPRFGKVLRHSLCREGRLRAWNGATQAYEIVVQRKIATSLPRVLALSCACAGTTANEGLAVWRGGGGVGGASSAEDGDGDNGGEEDGPWLPEVVEVELKGSGHVVVRELLGGGGDDGEEERWASFGEGGRLPKSIVGAIEQSSFAGPRKARYRLDAVVSYIKDPPPAKESVGGGASGEEGCGHHVLHMRIPPDAKKGALGRQLHQVDQRASTNEDPTTGEESQPSNVPWTLTSGISKDAYQERLGILQQKIKDSEEIDASPREGNDSEGDWILANGFVVQRTISEDARAFHVPFKEPCLVIFREVDVGEDNGRSNATTSPSEQTAEESQQMVIPASIMNTPSISSSRPDHANPSSDVPGKGSILAFDAEFVLVQHEQSSLTATGSKVTTREGRSALGRISILDCTDGRSEVLIDAHVLPREPVVDYLTRFSGIREGDLDPKGSPHHLVTTRDAYLKLRLLVESGCIFIGHGLSQDFATVNLFVPPDQIIDTVEIYHQANRRNISLRFLVNYVLSRDMQQDVHDSVEDARAAYELYARALELKKQGKFERYLTDIYEFGQKADWKVGLDKGNG